MGKKRFRDYGLRVGKLPSGPKNQIVDVPGVKVGHVTLSRTTGHGEAVCTGVTAILPHTANWFDTKVPAAAHVINGFGKTAGLVQVHELGVIEAPILLTNTLSVGAVTEGAIRYMLANDDDIGGRKGSLNVVVGECNDGYLNDLRGLYVRPEHAQEAIERALASDTVEEGSVGAGAGMRCFGWKGGIGTASRVLSFRDREFTVGSLVLTNFGESEDLSILGVPIGEQIRPSSEIRSHDSQASERHVDLPAQAKAASGHDDKLDESPLDGSIMIVLATDLPLSARQLGRLARRAVFGLARTGSIAHHGSGDIVIAFSTNKVAADTLPEGDETEFSLFFRGVVESTEEAILNSLATASDTVGQRNRFVPALPMDKVLESINSWQGPIVLE